MKESLLVSTFNKFFKKVGAAFFKVVRAAFLRY